MFQHRGELAFYLIVVGIKLAGYFVFMFSMQSLYGRLRNVLHAFNAALVTTAIGEGILLSLIASWSVLAGLAPNGEWHPNRGVGLLFVLLACFRYLAWLLVFRLFFRSAFRQRPSKRYALLGTTVSFGLDLVGIAIALMTPAGREVFFF